MIDSLSKTFGMTGWRLGYLALPPGLSKTILKFIQHSIYCVPSFVQAAGITALSLGRRAGAGLSRRCSARGSRRAARRLVVGARHQLQLPPATFYLFPSVEAPDTDVARRWLDEIDVATVPGSSFGQRRRRASADVADLLRARARRRARSHRADRNCGLIRAFTARKEKMMIASFRLASHRSCPSCSHRARRGVAIGLTAAAQAPQRTHRQDQGARQAARRRQARHAAVRLPRRQERAGRLRHRPACARSASASASRSSSSR